MARRAGSCAALGCWLCCLGCRLTGCWAVAAWGELGASIPPPARLPLPRRCATCAIDPAWLQVESVDRRAGLSLEDFREQYEIPNKPVILTDVVRRAWCAVLRRAGSGESRQPARPRGPQAAAGQQLLACAPPPCCLAERLLAAARPAPHTPCRRQVTKWPALRKWTREYLADAFKGGQVSGLAGRLVPLGQLC